MANCQKNNDKVRVLFVTASTKGGGAERMLFNIIRSMDSGHEVRLFVTSDQKVPDVYATDVESVNAGKRHAVSSFVRLVKYIRRFSPHHVFTTSSNVGYMLVLAKKILRSDYKIYIRCAVPPSEIYQTDIKTRLLNRIIRMTYNSAHLIIAQTDFSRDDLIKAYGVTPSKVRTIRNIVDAAFIRRQAELGGAPELNVTDYNMVAAGALYSVKGFDLLIEAVAPLVRDTNRHLYILGEERYEDGYRKFLENKIESLAVKDNVHLLGQKENPYPYFRQADLFIMSSRKEGFPNVVLEALTLDTPVVASDVVDWSGVIYPGENGYVAEKGSVDSLRENLAKAFVARFHMNKYKLNNFDYNELFS